MKVTHLTGNRFQLEPTNLSLPENLLAVAAEMRLWGYSLTVLADDGLHRIVVESDRGQEVCGTLTSTGGIVATDWRLRELLAGLAAGYQSPNEVKSGPVVARYGYFIMYQDGSYAGPPDYIAKGLAERVHRLVESGRHTEYNRLVAAGVGGELAFLRCLHDDWAQLVGSEAAQVAVLRSQPGGSELQA